MFLTKKSFRKILIIAICFFVVGTSSIAFAIFFTSIGIKSTDLFILGVVEYALDVLIVLWGRYAEGKGKLINLAHKLVLNELKPADFIVNYELLKNADDLIIKKPDIEVLQYVALAYNALDDRENTLLVVDEMLELASEKKKVFVNLMKASYLFSYNKKEEAETLFQEIQKQKMDMICMSFADDILKSDRAMAMGDYKTVEAYILRKLERSFPKQKNLEKLILNYGLGEVYEKLGENSKAITYYQYCVDFGGETAIKASAAAKLQ